MEIVEGGQGLREPEWSDAYTDPLDVAAARAHWAEIVRELRDAGTLAAVNGAAIMRAVDFRIVYEHARREVAERGLVIKPKRGSKTAIARPSPYWGAMREAASDLDRIEAELGLSPRRRGAVTKVDRKSRARAAADEFLRVAK